jgi:nucleoside-diphosphate-sugar epimerase
MSTQSAQGSFTDTMALGEAQRGERKRRVAVTGGSGKLGRSTVAYLAGMGSDEDWEVISIDTRRPPTASEDGKSGIGGAYRLVEIDLEDMGAVLETFMTIDMAYSGIDAVVHLAAIPSPGQTNSSRQFRTNTMSTYNVLEACRKLKIKNVVLASSETLIGIPFDPHGPGSLPITEEHERKPESAYSLSKLMGETMAEQFCRWDPELKIISLRFSNVMLPQEYANFEGWQKDPMARYWNCWGYIDARDGGQSVAKSLAATSKGHHAYLIAAEDTCMRTSNEELVKAAFPNAKYNPTSGPNDSLLSIEKAKKELGFKPVYKWQDQI